VRGMNVGQTHVNHNYMFVSKMLTFLQFFGMLMRPLEVQVETIDDYEEDPDRVPKTKPLLQRMAEDKRNYLDRGSLAGEFVEELYYVISMYYHLKHI